MAGAANSSEQSQLPPVFGPEPPPASSSKSILTKELDRELFPGHAPASELVRPEDKYGANAITNEDMEFLRDYIGAIASKAIAARDIDPTKEDARIREMAEAFDTIGKGEQGSTEQDMKRAKDRLRDDGRSVLDSAVTPAQARAFQALMEKKGMLIRGAIRDILAKTVEESVYRRASQLEKIAKKKKQAGTKAKDKAQSVPIETSDRQNGGGIGSRSAASGSRTDS